MQYAGFKIFQYFEKFEILPLYIPFLLCIPLPPEDLQSNIGIVGMCCVYVYIRKQKHLGANFFSQLGRRRIATRFEDEPEVKKEKRELVEVKDKKSEQKDKEVNKEPQKTGDKEEKKTLKKDAAQKAMVKKEDKNDKK